MPRKTFLYEPLNRLKPLAEDVWIVDGPRISMNVGPFRTPFPTRMTVIRLPEGLFLHSPIAFDAGLARAVAQLGPVRWLIAPNLIHYASIQPWLDAFPEAESWGVHGIEARAARYRIPITIHHRLGSAAPWAGQIDEIPVRSRFMEEVEFFHRASRTLILTDLIEAFAPARVTLLWRMIYRLAGNLGPIGGAPRDFRLTFRGRMGPAREAARRMVALEPARVVIAHGDCYLEDAPNKLRRGLGWLLR